MKRSQGPTESEMEILQILWQNGSCTVREVHETLSEKKDVGYTTTLKIMQIMADKNLVLRDTSSRTHVYTAAIDQESTQKSMLSNFITNTFGGSASSLVLQALGNHKTNDSELREIKNLIEQIENAQK
jgi:predicted transcriptional regulator